MVFLFVEIINWLSQFHSFFFQKLNQLGFTILSEYSLWFVPVCAFFALAITVILYFKNKKHRELSRIQRWTLRVLRFSGVFLLSCLLLSPFFEINNKEIQKPVIVFAQDNTASLLFNKDSSFYQTTYKDNLSAFLSSIGESYDTAFYRFGAEVERKNTVDYSFQGTDFSILFDEVRKKYYNRNVGAVILATDGVYNQGASPVYAAEQLDMNIPVYAVALGDTTMPTDLFLQKVDYNEIAFDEINTPVRIEVAARELKEQKASLTVINNGKKLYEKKLTINNDQFTETVDITITPDKIGLQVYDIILTPIDGEISHKNNTKKIAIDVLKSKKKILLAFAYPHPDVAAIKRSVDQNQLYELDVVDIASVPETLEDVSLLIGFHLLSDKKLSKPLLDKAKAADVPIMHFVGSRVDIDFFNEMDLGSKIETTAENSDFVTALYADDFAVFDASSEIKDLSQTTIPLLSPYGDYKIDADAKVLFYQKIGSVETSKPLVWVTDRSGVKNAIVCGEGVWRWRMNEMVKNSSFANFDYFINKSINYLSLSEKKERFKVNAEKIYSESTPVEFVAEVYNENYEPVNTSDVALKIETEDGKAFSYQFTKKGNRYFLDAGNFEQGTYNWNAQVEFDGKVLTKKGTFTVVPVDVEALNTVADHAALQQMAQNRSAKLFFPSQFDALLEDINQNSDITPLSFTKTSLKDLASVWWYFLLIVFLFASEWFFRKYWGLY